MQNEMYFVISNVFFFLLKQMLHTQKLKPLTSKNHVLNY